MLSRSASATMLCSTCQEIFRASEFIQAKITYAVGKYKHTEYTQDIRESALYTGCQICAILCLHFDREDPQKQPIERLNLRYAIRVDDWDTTENKHELTAASKLYISFIYQDQSSYNFIRLYIDGDEGCVSITLISSLSNRSNRYSSIHLPELRLTSHKHILGRRVS